MKYYISKDLLKEKKDIEGKEDEYIEIEITEEKEPEYKRVEVHEKV